MNFKKIIATALVGATLAFAGIASAATIDINVYGASAQYTFWKAYAPVWIKTQSGCSAASPTGAVATVDGNNAIVYATCGGNTYNIRVGNKASFDGPLSILGDDSQAGSGKCTSTSLGYPGSASVAAHYRMMIDESTCSGASCTGLKCERITVGASDVAGESFTQYSEGALHGTREAFNGDYLVRSFNGINTSSLTDATGGCGTGSHCAKPFVVPFAFMVNNSVKESGLTIDNLTRMQAVLLFSGQIADWSQFGVGFTPQHVAVCLRHSGSGTHATLDYAVIKGNGWGGVLSGLQNRPDDVANYDSTLPAIYFNDSTGDLLTCLNNTAGSVGYADADKAVSLTVHTIKTGSCLAQLPSTSAIDCPNVTEIAYQGEYASADAIKNGRYDFWTNEWAYKDPAYANQTLLTNFVNGANAASNIPASEVPFWVVSGQKIFDKATDATYPSKL